MQNKPNSTFLYPCIPASLHTWILQNKPNYSVNPVNPVKKIILRNEPNFPRRGYVGLRHPMRSRGIILDRVRPILKKLIAGSRVPLYNNSGLNLFDKE